MSAFGGREPFDDPFFTDPFGGMDRMMNRMNTMMGSMFSDPFFSDPFFNPPRGMPQLDGSGLQQHRRLPGPTITEVHADDEQQGNVEGDDAPIVEEPEDVGAVRRREGAAPERGVRHMSMPEHNWMPEVRHGASGGAQMWSFSSSTFHSSGGPGGHTYTKSMSARTGPGGLSEMRAFEKDSRSGQQREAQRRGIGSRQRTMTRTRNAAGREDQRDILQGMNSAEEVSRFEEDWNGRARSLHEPVRGMGRWPTSGWDGGMQSAALPSAPHPAFNGGAPPLMQAPYERYNSRYGQR